MLTANPDIDLVVSFFFSFLLLIAGIDVDDGGKRQKMSLLVIAIFFPSFIQLSDARGRKKEKKSFIQSVILEDAENSGDWLV